MRRSALITMYVCLVLLAALAEGLSAFSVLLVLTGTIAVLLVELSVKRGDSVILRLESSIQKRRRMSRNIPLKK